MSVSTAITVNQILTRVAVETGLPVAQDPFGSSREEYIQLKTLLQTACEDLCLAHNWEFLTKTFEIVTETDKREYKLPDDFMSIVDQTGWNLTADEPIYIVTPQQWRAIEAGDIDPINYGYRIIGGNIAFVQKNIPAGTSLKFEYQSSYFVFPATDAIESTDTITSGNDTIIFDRTLISRYLKSIWLESKGFDNSSALSSFVQVFEMLIGKDTGGGILNAGGGRGFRLINTNNVPDHGYGV